MMCLKMDGKQLYIIKVVGGTNYEYTCWGASYHQMSVAGKPQVDGGTVSWSLCRKLCLMQFLVIEMRILVV